MSEGDGDAYFGANASKRARLGDKQVHPDTLKKVDAIFGEALRYIATREEIEAAEALADAAEPGEWRVKDGVVVRFGGELLSKPETLAFVAKTRTLVPRLVKAVFALRRAMIGLVTDAAVARAESKRSRDALDRHREEIAAGVATGPEHELTLLVEATRLGVRGTCEATAEFWKRWLAGHSIAAELRDDVLRAHEHEAERKRIEQETRARFEADVVELRRLLAELRAGRLPPELEQKKGRRR
jgi:hypothetical protein